jgi:effector-binding domain-containing protein
MVLERGEQPALTIRTRTAIQNMPTLLGETYGKIAAYLKQAGKRMSDVPFVAYYNMDMKDLDVEIGFPVAEALPGNDEVKPSSIPAGKYVAAMHRGPYTEMEPFYKEMMEWMKDHKFEATGTAYEVYYNGPEFPQEEALTMVMMPVK